jgi:hypothetical protein
LAKNIVSVRGLLVQALLAAVLGAGLGIVTVAGLGAHRGLGGLGGAFLGVTGLLLYRLVTAPACSSGGTEAFRALGKVAFLGGLIGTTAGVCLWLPLGVMSYNPIIGELWIPVGGVVGATSASFLWALAHLLVPPPGPSSLGSTGQAENHEPTAKARFFLLPDPRETDQVFRANRHPDAAA